MAKTRIYLRINPISVRSRGTMPNVIVEPEEGGTFAAIQNRRVIARGNTQLKAGEKAHEIRPNDHVVAARVRTIADGEPDKFRHMFGPKRKAR
jgi:hypothetical protein